MNHKSDMEPQIMKQNNLLRTKSLWQREDFKRSLFPMRRLTSLVLVYGYPPNFLIIFTDTCFENLWMKFKIQDSVFLSEFCTDLQKQN